MNIIVAGIGTDVGKTVVSAILCQALEADYWKPVQAGELDNSDSHKIEKWVSRLDHTIWPEAYRLSEPISPHAAAKIDALEIDRQMLKAPNMQQKNLVIELAGGLMVPLAENFLTVDLAQDLQSPVILVANYYLGSINHSLLSLALLKARKIPTLGIIFNGAPNLQSRDAILQESQVSLLGEIPSAEQIDAAFIKTHADQILKHPRLAEL